MIQPLRPLPLVALLVLSLSPAGAQEDGSTPPEEEQGTAVSIGNIERQVFEQDGDLVSYLRVQDLEVKVGELILALQLQDLPQLRELLSNPGSQSGEGGSGSSEQEDSDG